MRPNGLIPCSFVVRTKNVENKPVINVLSNCTPTLPLHIGLLFMLQSTQMITLRLNFLPCKYNLHLRGLCLPSYHWQLSFLCNAPLRTYLVPVTRSHRLPPLGVRMDMKSSASMRRGLGANNKIVESEGS